MKKTLLIAVTLLTNFVFAQTQLSDYYDAAAANRPEFSYNVSVRIKKNEGATSDAKRYTATLTQVSPDPKGFYNANYDRKFYSCSQLGTVCNPNNYNRLSIKIFYTCNGQQKVAMVGLGNVNDQQFVAVVLGAGGSFCESIDFDSIEVIGAVLSPTHTEQIRVKIGQLNAGSNPSSNSSSNPITQTKAANPGMPANTSGNDPLANYTAPAPQYSSDKTIEAVGQLSNAVTPLLEEWGANLQRRREAREQKEAEETSKKKESTENYFKSQLALYLKAANNGDENARMKLVSLHSYNLSYGTDFSHYLPNLNSWIETAAKNKNFDAMCFVGRLIYAQETYLTGSPYGVKTKDEAFKVLEDAANLGSLDAMTFLGGYYNLKKKFRGGADAEKARYWYAKAADSGCPAAAYNMGMIYRYKTSDSFSCVTHKIDKNDTLAFNYFVKGTSNPGYEDSLFQEADTRACHFIDFSYKELSIMYQKGIGCEKDKVMADKLQQEYMK